MFAPVLSAIPKLFPAEACSQVLTEPTIGVVIPDILIGHWDSPDVTAPALTNIARHVLASLQKRAPGAAVRTEEIAQELFLSSSGMARAADQLRRAGLLEISPPDCLSLSPQVEVINHFKIIAVEMKLTRWREALQQAVRYLEFADRAYVVLDGNRVCVSDEMKRAFGLSAAGLYLQRGSDFELVFDACGVPQPLSADRFLAVQKLVDALPHCLA